MRSVPRSSSGGAPSTTALKAPSSFKTATAVPQAQVAALLGAIVPPRGRACLLADLRPLRTLAVLFHPPAPSGAPALTAAESTHSALDFICAPHPPQRATISAARRTKASR
jgi:hypothetical protein